MRKIKFRALMKNKRQWVYGDLISPCHDINNKYSIFQFKGGCVKVKQNTIGQYTGLKDKNGKEIYEGDIVKTIGHHYSDYKIETELYVVAPCMAGWELMRELKSGGSEHTILGDPDDEVIGNIYDNPELMEVLVKDGKED